MIKKNLNKILLLAAVLILLAGSAGAPAVLAAATADSAVELATVVNDYIRCLQTRDFAAALALLPATGLGDDPLIHNAAAESQNLGEAARLQLTASATARELLANQYDFVTAQFGADAWTKVAYQIVPIGCPERVEVYQDADSGRILAKADALQITDLYWQELAQAKGITLADFLQPKAAAGQRDASANLNILTARELGYRPPVRVVLADAYACSQIVLSFNGGSESAAGEYNFILTADRQKGHWALRQGLQWEIAPPAGLVTDK